jgi:hypothetical protein
LSDRLDLWDSKGLAPIATLDLPLIATSLTASPDGAHVFLATAGGGATVWDLRPAKWVDRACADAGRVLTRAEWKRYVGATPYDPACR